MHYSKAGHHLDDPAMTNNTMFMMDKFQYICYSSISKLFISCNLEYITHPENIKKSKDIPQNN